MKFLKTFYIMVFVCMVVICIIASLQQNVFEAALEIGATTWGAATFMDVYFAFITIIFWIFARESKMGIAAMWALAILTLGNIAIAAYMLLILFREKPDSFQDFFLKKKSEEFLKM